MPHNIYARILHWWGRRHASSDPALEQVKASGSPTQLGRTFVQQRQLLEITEKEAARRAGISLQLLRVFETTRDPVVLARPELLKLADVLGCRFTFGEIQHDGEEPDTHFTTLYRDPSKADIVRTMILTQSTLRRISASVVHRRLL